MGVEQTGVYNARNILDCERDQVPYHTKFFFGLLRGKTISVGLQVCLHDDGEFTLDIVFPPNFKIRNPHKVFEKDFLRLKRIIMRRQQSRINLSNKIKEVGEIEDFRNSTRRKEIPSLLKEDSPFFGTNNTNIKGTKRNFD